MTHSNHRQGTYSNLSDDFVVQALAGREFPDLQARLKQFRDIGFRHHPVNVPGVNSPMSKRHFIYDLKEKVCNLLRDLADADLGLSVIVTGLRGEVRECCHAADLSPHTVNQSLGFWGKTEKLPPFRILEITTMCGHGRIPPNLVWDLAAQVQHHVLGTEEAARKMGKLCLCNIFNEIRARKLMDKLTADLEDGTIINPHPIGKTDIAQKKDFGITIDEVKCNGCTKCIPYCPQSAIIESSNGRTVNIDADRCTECGLCVQAKVCPVEAIVPRDLTWPRTLRGKFQSPHAPYRETATLASVSASLRYSDKAHIFNRHQNPSELTNDAKGLLRHGDAVIMAEVGRPHVGATFRDVQEVIQALIPFGLQLDQQYPSMDDRSSLADVATDVSKGILCQDILGERIGWIILRLLVSEQEVRKVLQSLRKVATEIDTVFAVDVVSRVERDGSTVADRIAPEIKAKPAINCKTNVGLGHPLSVP